MVHRPWNMSTAEIDRALRQVVQVVSADVLRVAEPDLRDDHVELLERARHLRWDVGVELLVGTIDPADDEGDVPLCLFLMQTPMPREGSRAARSWFVTLERARWNDEPVSVVVQAVAAYTVAFFEDELHREHEVERWIRTAATMTEDDERVGLGMVVYVRSARLLGRGA